MSETVWVQKDGDIPMPCLKSQLDYAIRLGYRECPAPSAEQLPLPRLVERGPEEVMSSDNSSAVVMPNAPQKRQRATRKDVI